MKTVLLVLVVAVFVAWGWYVYPMQKELRELRPRVPALEEQVRQKDEELKTKKAEIEGLRTEMQGLRKDLEDQKAKLAELTEKYRAAVARVRRTGTVAEPEGEYIFGRWYSNAQLRSLHSRVSGNYVMSGGQIFPRSERTGDPLSFEAFVRAFKQGIPFPELSR